MANRRPILLDAPSNLGLRPPEEGAVPGCYKMPWALRDRGLREAIGADDAGNVIPARYRAKWKTGDGVRNAEAIADFSLRLADRLQPLFRQRRKVLVLGGDCSILIGNMLALKRIGRYGLVFMDAHSDFRHPGNAPAVGAAAGEDLAIVTGYGDERLIHLNQMGPYVRNEDVHVVGVRANDDDLDELAERKIRVTTSDDLNMRGTMRGARHAQRILNTVTVQTDGFWVHFDVDVIDDSEMMAADCPEPNGISFAKATSLLRVLLASPKCAGIEVTIYDPDLDPTGVYADRLVKCLVTAFAPKPR